jgi:hypothetical protein
MAARPPLEAPVEDPMKRVATFVFLFGCLVGLGAQVPELDSPGKAVRRRFEGVYPPDRTYAVVTREDLPTLSVKARESGFPIEVQEVGWKGPGSMFRGKPAGTLALGEVMKVEHAEYGNDQVTFRVVSVDPHEIVVEPGKPERNRREQVVTRLTFPHNAGFRQLMQTIDAYVRLFPSLDAAREYARSIRDPLPARRFTLGVVRRDGILLPIAMYDNGEWYRRWPLPAAEHEVPIGLRDVPSSWFGVEGASATWTLWTADGKSRPLHVSNPIAVGTHCLMNVGLQTDYRTTLPHPPLDQQHYPKDGIATTGSVPIEPVQVATIDLPAWSNLQAMLQGPANQLEARYFQLLPWSALAVRSITPVKLEVLCLANGLSKGAITGYFEAAKRYQPPDTTAPNACGVVTFVHGWVHRSAQGAGQLDRTTRAEITDCSMWNVEYRRPLGVLRLGTTPIWIVEVSRWGGESYEIVEITERGTLLLMTIPGGACKK